MAQLCRNFKGADVKKPQAWIAERRGADVFTRKLVLWHKSAPDVVFDALVSLELVQAGTQDEWIPDLVSGIEAPSEWLVKSMLPMQGPDLRPIELHWLGSPVHFGYVIPTDKLRFA
jgi:hypothetical protein